MDFQERTTTPIATLCLINNRIRNRRDINSKDQIIKDKIMNFSYENGAAGGHDFYQDK